MKHLIFTVTNDLTTDQRMIRICSTLVAVGYDVLLVGRKQKSSKPLSVRPFRQKRFSCFFDTGKAFYIEYNIRLYFLLLFSKADLICAIDLDTILPCFFISKIKSCKRVYDAHELFCEMQEVVTRPRIYKFWKGIEQFAVSKFPYGYTINAPIAAEFKRMYKVDYSVIRNLPVLMPLTIPEKTVRYILYQGAVNEGRSFETLIPAMKYVHAQLIICGDGNFMSQARALTREHGLEKKIIFKGKLSPEELLTITLAAWAGVTLFESTGLSNYYSLANRFFDYCHACLPQVCVNYPVYKEINNQHSIAVLIDDLRAETIAAALNKLLENDGLYRELQENCMKAREVLNWQLEEKKLIEFYAKLF